MQKTDNILRQLSIIFFANKRLIFFTTSVLSILTLVVAFFYPPVYNIEGSILIKSKKVQVPFESSNETKVTRVILPPTKEDVILETRVITNLDLIETSITDLIERGELVINESFSPIDYIKNKIIKPVKQRLFHSVEARELTEVEKMALDISENLNINIVPGSNIIDVLLQSNDADQGTLILNSMFDNYLLFRLDLFTSKGTNDFFLEQMNIYKDKLDEFEQQKLNLLDELKVVDVDNDVMININLVDSITKEMDKLDDEYIEKGRAVQYLDILLMRFLKNDVNIYQPFPYKFENQDIREFNEQLNVLRFDYLKKTKIYKKDTPTIRILEDQIKKLSEKQLFLIKSTIREKKYELETIKGSIENKQNKLDLLLVEIKKAKAVDSKLNRLLYDIKLYQDNYKIFFSKYEESRIEQKSQITQMSNVQILSKAGVPDKPYFPRKPLVIPIGIITGFLLGLSIGFIKEFFDHSFKTPEQVEQYLELPVIGSIEFKDS
ncbi:MAG: hypothetical protein KJ737_12495 [Proteobacteria bacterium]|nr:hypothetical protein [Pseudomonadota bacterium]